MKPKWKPATLCQGRALMELLQKATSDPVLGEGFDEAEVEACDPVPGEGFDAAPAERLPPTLCQGRTLMKLL